MINNKKYACPDCENYGLIGIANSGGLICGKCGYSYTEDEALDLTESDSNE